MRLGLRSKLRLKLIIDCENKNENKAEKEHMRLSGALAVRIGENI
jgi:hypothetical protein